MIYILVDHDNLKKNRYQEYRRGLVDIVEVVCERFMQLSGVEIDRIMVRLYGGWFAGNNITRPAQEIVRAISVSFPRTFSYVRNEVAHKYIVNVEMAYTLLINQREQIYNTYRTRNTNIDFRFKHPISIGCHDSECPLIGVSDIINHRRCNHGKCLLTLENIIERDEQKLVDTMIGADTIFLLQNNGNNYVCIVSSDDDFMPFYMHACAINRDIYHIDTNNMRSQRSCYARLLNAHYHNIVM